MKTAMAVMHLSVAQRFPGVLSWVPRRRGTAGPGAPLSGPDTLVLARSEAAFHAWIGLDVRSTERARYAYLSSPKDLDGFHGRVMVLPGGARRGDAREMVEAIQPRVQSGMLRWAA
jgi:hypothetical protein